MTKALILDADGMLVTGEQFSQRLAREFGISASLTEPFFRNEFQQCLVGLADLKEELSKYLSLWGWKSGVNELLNYWFADKYTLIDQRFGPVLNALRTKGIKLYLATNNEKYRTDYLVRDRKLGAWFDSVFSSGYVGLKKPEGTFFQHILDETGMQKRHMVFWDDDENNVAGASDFGLPTQVYKNFAGFQAATKKFL